MSTPIARFWTCLVAATCVVSPLTAQHSYTPADIEDGGRLYQSNCARCHGPDGDGISGVDFVRGRFRRVTTDDELARTIIGGIAGTGMPPGNFSETEAGTIVAYLRSMASSGAQSAGLAGDRIRGKSLFEGKGQCLTCHGVNGRGSRLGPDLSDIGSLRRSVELERSIVDPDAEVPADYRFVQAIALDSTAIRGRLLNQDLFTLQLFDSSERLVSLVKASLREFTVLKNSTMPPYRNTLNAEDVADLVGYLRSLKGAR